MKRRSLCYRRPLHLKPFVRAEEGRGMKKEGAGERGVGGLSARHISLLSCVISGREARRQLPCACNDSHDTQRQHTTWDTIKSVTTVVVWPRHKNHVKMYE